MYHSVCESNNLFVTQILREISLGDYGNSKLPSMYLDECRDQKFHSKVKSFHT